MRLVLWNLLAFGAVIGLYLLVDTTVTANDAIVVPDGSRIDFGPERYDFGPGAEDYFVQESGKPETFVIGADRARLVYDGGSWLFQVLDPTHVRVEYPDGGR